MLDFRASLLDYLDSRVYHDYLGNFLVDMARKDLIQGSMTGANMCSLIASSLRMSEAFHVHPDMMPLIRAAAADLEDDDWIDHSRLPAEHGFLMFGEPWLTRDVWGLQMAFAAIHWRHGSANIGGVPTPGVWLTYFTDTNIEEDESTQRLMGELGHTTMNSIGRLHVNHIGFLAYREPVGPSTVMTDEAYAKFALDGDLAGPAPNPNRLVVALFRLLNQVIVETSEVPVDRPTVRRMTRKNLPVRVQTIKLRRKTKARDGEETVGEGHVEWSHSWAVRGHWAWRKCGPHHVLAEEYEKGYRARIYIAPYIKGPEDKPILLTEKVWGLAR